VSLPGADELFRATSSQARSAESTDAADVDPVTPTVTAAVRLAPVRTTSPAAGRGRAGGRPTGREKHDEKITVYVSPEELVALEHARLDLRAVHGLAVDRGRIVREAVAVVLADLEAKGADSILVRRLRDR
jgi:hypothetical protein